MKLLTPFHRHSRAGGNSVKKRFGMTKLKPHMRQISTKQNKLSAKPVWISACAPQGYSDLLSAKALAKSYAGMTGLELLKANQ